MTRIQRLGAASLSLVDVPKHVTVRVIVAVPKASVSVIGRILTFPGDDNLTIELKDVGYALCNIPR
jgi:hypothetical protein